MAWKVDSMIIGPGVSCIEGAASNDIHVNCVFGIENSESSRRLSGRDLWMPTVL